VGVIILNPDGLVLIAQRIDKTSEAWQMPQGGIDEGEDAQTALHRELLEEIGTNKINILHEYPEWLYYDLPEAIRPRLWKGRYNGQRQKWFLTRFTGNDTDINLETEEPEFLSWRWEHPHNIVDLAVEFKQDIYRHLFSWLSSVSV